MGMQNKYIEKLNQLVLAVLAGEDVKIILFGSRARGEGRVTSDVDIGLIPYGKIDKRKLLFLEEKIEELNIPYKVEIVNFLQVSADFKREAMKGAVVWKDWN